MPDIPKSLVPQLRKHSFPGNLRELEGLVYDAVANLGASNTLPVDGFEPAALVDNTKSGAGGNGNAGNLFSGLKDLPTLREATASLIDEALDRAGFNQAVAAELLGMTRAALNKRLTRAKRGQNRPSAE